MKRILPLLLIFAAWACGSDEPSRPPDVPQRPTLTYLSLAPDSILADTVAIAVAAERADRAVLLVDNAETAVDSLAPFVLEWDTRGADNGSHLLTILAVNEGGYADTTFGCLVNNPGGGVVVLVRPAEVTLASADTARFAATVLGVEDQKVTWSLGSVEIPEEAKGRRPGLAPRRAPGAGPAGAAADGLGAVDSTGLYTAPPVVPEGLRILVQAASPADPGAAGTATVTVTQGPAVAVTAAPAEVILGRTYQLEATVYALEDSTVTWSVVEGATHGSIDEEGLYTAPDVLPDPARVTFRAAAGTDPELSDTTSASMIAPILVTVAPGAPTVSENGYLRFAATLENAESQGVRWIVAEGRRHGTIDASGLYAAPDRVPDPPHATVIAISADDARFSGSVTVELVEGPPAGEAALLAAMFEAGVHAANLTEQLTGIVGIALDLARALGGDPDLAAGTLEQIDDAWYYTGGPPDALEVIPQHGPAWSIAFVSANGSMSPPVPGEYAGGMFFYGHLDCTVTIDGHAFHLTNLSWAPVAAKPGDLGWNTRFQRSVEGSVPDDAGGLREVSYQHTGVYEWTASAYVYDFTVDGTLQNPDGLSLTLSEILSVSHTCNCPGLEGFDGRELRGVLTAGIGADTYVWNNLAAYTYHRLETVVRENEWRGEGTLLKNGVEYGTVDLALPLPGGIDEHPRPILSFAHGHQLILLMPPMEEVPWMVPNPFED